MVAHPRATAGINRLRPLNKPRPIKVQEDASGNPIAILWQGRRLAVAAINDRWRIDDEWWRNEISRLYHQVVLNDGRIMTMFRDLLGGGWFTQSAPPPDSRRHNLHILAAHIARATGNTVRGADRVESFRVE
ncbi:MAG: hypothetical protein HYY30_03100 [Chloroflexi bacterium]|nr:hypothetical protein [Chloroflexota bacterium]